LEPLLAQPESPIALDAITETELSDEDSLTEVSSIILHEESTSTDVLETPSPQAPPPAGTFDLDEFWSNVKDALQKRHIPTYSVVSTHAFPISFDPESDVFVLGVAPNLQKTVEGKLDHVKAASAAVLDRPINVRLKVVTDQPPGGQPPPGGSRKPGSGPSPTPRSTTGLTDSQPAQATQTSQPRQKEPASQPQATSEADPDEDERRQTSDSLNTSNQSKSSTPIAAEIGRPPLATSPGTEVATLERPAPNQVRTENRAIESGLIQEAYKLFQGPGSRLII